MKNASSPPPETISLPALASFFIATLSVLLWNGCSDDFDATDESEIRVILNPYHPKPIPS